MIDTKPYDTIVIGAGIAGCCVALALQKSGQRVLLVDRFATPASGGSGAAGAFVSPKIGKGGSLQSLTNKAFAFSKDFYISNFPEHFNQSGLLRLPRDINDAEKFNIYKSFNTNIYKVVNKTFLTKHGIKNEKIGFLFDEAGVCDAPKLCISMSHQISFSQFCVDKIMHDGIYWKVLSANSLLLADNIVLATGHQNNLLEIGYMGIKGTWGSRGDYLSSLPLGISLHKKISISKNINGVIKLGATHVKVKEACLPCNGNSLISLEKQAVDMIGDNDLVLKEIFCGMRAGSRDYFPLAGKIVDVARMAKEYPNIFRGARPDLLHIPKAYILNGMGGRGFVFAPLMAKWLSELIVYQKDIDKRVNPDRLFLKWARKQIDK